METPTNGAWWAEVRRRLERLEKCEAAIEKCTHAGECGYDAARAPMEESQASE